MNERPGGPFRSEHRGKVWGPASAGEWCRTTESAARCVRLRGLTYEDHLALRSTTATNDTSEIRSQKASNSLERPAGQTWERLESGEKVRLACPIFRYVSGREQLALEGELVYLAA